MSETRFHFLEIGRRLRRQRQEPISMPAVATLDLRLAETIGSFGHRLGEFNSPAGIALDGEGNLYVADSRNHRIQKITPAGDVYGLGGPDVLVNPQGVVVDGVRFIYVVEQGADRLRKFSSTGYLMFTLGGPHARARRFDCPTAVCLDPYHQLYIADADSNRVTCYSATGHWQMDYHGPTPALALSRPQGVAVDAQGHICVSDTMHHRILRLNPDGKLDTVIGRPGPERGELSEPRGLAIDVDGGVWVADSGNNRVQKFSAEGRSVCCFPEPNRRGAVLSWPTAVAVNGEGSIYVSDTLNHRVVRLAPTGD